MPKRVSKQRDGKAVAENIAGRPVPRKGGLTNETKGKSLGSRPRLRVGRSVVNFARRGR
jgi:hypothetical protein